MKSLNRVVSRSTWSAERIALRIPLIVVVLAATAIPIEFVPHGHNPIHLGVSSAGLRVGDALANVAGYLPIGIVLGELGLVRAVIMAAVMAILAESSQLVMMYRDPSVIDVASNVTGAILGVMIGKLWRIPSPAFRITTRIALIAATLAAGLVGGVWATAGDATNTRGATTPGTLEAQWAFDEDGGRMAMDSSGHGLNGRFVNQPQRVAGLIGNAVKLDSERDYIDVGHSEAFRLVGSMTVTAWIKSASYPLDDAAIVSNRDHISGVWDGGFQLDTTIDRGPRAASFKLGDSCGRILARYGATPLRLDTWYHVAGVYDAEAQTINVYLNGEPDNGFLLGSPSRTRLSARKSLYVGRRNDLDGFPFTGLLDDVRIYSLALTKTEVAAVMHGASVDRPAAQAAATDPDGGNARDVGNTPASCEWTSEFEDARIPGAVAVLGVLVAVAWIGVFGPTRIWLCLVVNFLAGWLLLLVASGTLPRLNRWTFPLTSLAGGASVVVSLGRRNKHSRHAAE